MKYIEVMWAEQYPDIYSGSNCDEIKADWCTSELGGKEGPTGGMNEIGLRADTFPPGTRVTISVPVCPECGESSELAFHCKNDRCDCGFDWKSWITDKYS